MDDVAGPLVRALLEERVGYVARDLPERVRAVDEELRRHGAEPPVEEAVTAPAERPGGARPAGSQRRGTGRSAGEKRGR